MTVSNAEALSELRQAHAGNAADIAAKFVAGTFGTEFTSAVGHKYVVRGVPSEDYAEYEGSPTEWPRCLNTEGTLVTGVMVEVSQPGAPQLVGLWAFSVMGDETLEYDLEGAKEECWEFMRANEDRVDGEWNDAFSVSSGDQAVASFDCPALANVEACKLMVAGVVGG